MSYNNYPYYGTRTYVQGKGSLITRNCKKCNKQFTTNLPDSDKRSFYCREHRFKKRQN